jgi:hypothetical protein
MWQDGGEAKQTWSNFIETKTDFAKQRTRIQSIVGRRF